MHYYYFAFTSHGVRRYIKRRDGHYGTLEDGDLFQLTVYGKTFETPDFLKGGVMYQIFPDRFCNGTPEKNGDDITPWRNHGTVTNEEKFGGNLEGIRQRLSYLQELGITGIYLNPIMKAESNHKYDTTDYTKIDPSFGDADTMKALCKEAHEKLSLIHI